MTLMELRVDALETDRLLLRSPHLEDAKSFSMYNGEEKFYRYLPIDPPTPESTKEYINHLIAQGNEIPLLNNYFVITDRNTKEVLGDIYISIQNPEAGIAVIGFGLNPVHWGKGYMSEALREIIDMGFEKLKLKRIYAICDPDNAGSAKVMEKCGMKYEGRHRCEEFIRGKYQDNLYYAIIDTDSRP